jgi:hypothetical protein
MIRIEIFHCKQHSIYAVALNDQCITDSWCCANWKSIMCNQVPFDQLRVGLLTALGESDLRPEPVAKRGDHVRYIQPKKDGPQGIGRITSNPRKGTRIAHVKWPDGWAGHCFLDELIKDDPE